MSKRDSNIQVSRRQAMARLLLGGAGIWNVRSLASGLPVAWLMDPRRALAAAAAAQRDAAATTMIPQYLVLSTSGAGDPVNCNAPGTYADSGILHPSQSSMAATNLSINGTTSVAAAPWASLPQAALDSTAFIHHATTTVVHPDEDRVLELMGAVNNRAMLTGAVSAILAPKLGTVQAAPISLGGTDIVYNGSPQPYLNPTALSTVLAPETSTFLTMQKQRDQDLDSINAYFRQNATAGQRTFLDAYVTSQTQVRDISASLISQLESLTDNSATSQVKAAVILIQLKISPVVSLGIPFGGDNHFDSGLGYETSQTVSGVSAINTLYSQLSAAGITNQVTFALINVFGRTMATSNSVNAGGRSHNQNHHVTLLMGPQVNGGIYGGPTPMDGDYGALDIDSTTGQGVTNGDIPLADGLASVGKTIGVALGIDSATVDTLITGGLTIQAAVRNT